MSTYVVGDVQGCLASLDALLVRCRFGDDDVLVSVGDVVNRGPDSLGVLRLLKSLGARFRAVLGNHDLHFLATVYAAGEAQARHKGDSFDDVLAAADCERLAHWMRHWPLLAEVKGALVVHAGVPHIWSLARVRARARELEDALRGPRHGDFFESMYGDEPAQWHDALAGGERLRLIASYFTRMRGIALDGRLDFDHKGGADGLPSGFAPWFAYPPKTSKSILFGHWAALNGVSRPFFGDSRPLLGEGRPAFGDGPASAGDSPPAGDDGRQFIGLDTGCVWGRSLTALRLEDRALFSVPAQEPRNGLA